MSGKVRGRQLLYNFSRVGLSSELHLCHFSKSRPRPLQQQSGYSSAPKVAAHSPLLWSLLLREDDAGGAAPVSQSIHEPTITTTLRPPSVAVLGLPPNTKC